MLFPAMITKAAQGSTPIGAGGSSTNVNYKVQATWSVATNTYSLGGTIHVQNRFRYLLATA